MQLSTNVIYFFLFSSLSVYLQTGEYATDEEEEMSPVFPNSIEVFDLAENQDMLSPVELDPEKLAHKFKEVQLVLCCRLNFKWIQLFSIKSALNQPCHISFII